MDIYLYSYMQLSCVASLSNPLNYIAKIGFPESAFTAYVFAVSVRGGRNTLTRGHARKYSVAENAIFVI